MATFATGQGDLLVEQTKPFEDPSGDDMLVVEHFVPRRGATNEASVAHDDLIDECLTAHQQEAAVTASQSYIPLFSGVVHVRFSPARNFDLIEDRGGEHRISLDSRHRTGG
ncbi:MULTISPECIES: hypothetical protein [Pseudomonadota]|jgi:hypothetical protein|uniref:hypothetical protein n=1 Tax=Pseudomonadota TaxID=1224 RepID=UPI000C566890|nr:MULTISPECIES: hypothetical protein [Pseudomonadota]MBS50979.1 hypothetical protein [Sphingobium sp.]NBB38787.1 hypothetical protein [Sphingobium yanoikuyae]MCC4256827.1 hypothetical protein [Sphingobium lactosutens]NBB37268.1 hypothetical protein [Pseudomonas sp. BC115LW]HCW62864.1 hypothetical protein [Sphingobium sp.]|tara:strand:+ start:10780 stop:11112 length:333 start_codon:yes stop_codon:yes gene_type:complete